VYLGHLSHPGEELPYDDDENLLEDRIANVESEGALRRIAHWQPERTHESGKGTDWVSVWRHVNAAGGHR
jgi:methyl halide transferase